MFYVSYFRHILSSRIITPCFFHENNITRSVRGMPRDTHHIQPNRFEKTTINGREYDVRKNHLSANVMSNNDT